MKKVMFAMALVLVGGAAFAASVAIPWYADALKTGVGYPVNTDTFVSLVYLKSNADVPLTCTIGYYNAAGDFLGPFAPNNTFLIAPQSALAFRPTANDPTVPFGGIAGGQEEGQGLAVPNRPRSKDSNTPIDGTTVLDQKINGSITISWEIPAGYDAEKGTKLIQGSVVGQARAGAAVVSYGYQIPPGL